MKRVKDIGVFVLTLAIGMFFMSVLTTTFNVSLYSPYDIDYQYNYSPSLFLNFSPSELAAIGALIFALALLYVYYLFQVKELSR